MDFGDPNKFDYARRVAGALAYIGMANMDSAGVLPFSEQLLNGRYQQRGRGRIFELLNFLSGLAASGRTDLSAVTRAFVSRVRRPGLVVVISDFYGLTSAKRAIDQLRFCKHEIYVIQVAAPWELNPPIRGETRLVDRETSAHEDLTISDSLLRRYKAAFERSCAELKNYGMRYSIGYALAQSDVPFDAFLVNVLQRGGLVA
jgi:uncharacterized protein (DUF58 family)